MIIIKNKSKVIIAKLKKLNKRATEARKLNYSWELKDTNN